MIDVSGAISEYLAASRPDRKGHGGLSVSQVANSCPRAVYWELRHGKKPWDRAQKFKFEMGHLWEAKVLDGLQAQGYVETPPGRQVAIFGTFQDVSNGRFLGPGGTKALLMDAETFDADPTRYAAPDVLIGHVEHLVQKPGGPLYQVEVKTTHNFGRPFPETIPELLKKSGQYVLQTVANSKACGALAMLHVIDRASGVDRDYEIPVDAYWDMFLARWERMLGALGETEPDIDLPSWTIKPNGSSYLCNGCPAVKCAERRA